MPHKDKNQTCGPHRDSSKVAENIDIRPTFTRPTPRRPSEAIPTSPVRPSSINQPSITQIENQASRGEPSHKGSHSNSNNKRQVQQAQMWPYDHSAGCRNSKGKRYLEVAWPNTFVPVDEVEGGEEEWAKHLKLKRQRREQGERTVFAQKMQRPRQNRQKRRA